MKKRFKKKLMKKRKKEREEKMFLLEILMTSPNCDNKLCALKKIKLDFEKQFGRKFVSGEKGQSFLNKMCEKISMTDLGSIKVNFLDHDDCEKCHEYYVQKIL